MFKKEIDDLNLENIKKIDAYFRATNYLSVGQLYLLNNPLLEEKLSFDHIKSNIVGHWGTAPGQNFIYVHLNRIIKKYGLSMIYVSGPGHGGQAMVANTYLEGTYTEFYPNITQDKEGLKKLFKQFSFPGGISSHVAPETPGSINEGGELGYSLAHSYGAALDNSNLIVACVVGDGEAETGPLAASWHINKIINPKTDGVVLPILHLNGYKIANPSLFARMTKEELYCYFVGCGYDPYFVEGCDPYKMHKAMGKTLDLVIEKIKSIKTVYNAGKTIPDLKWPMIILKTPKGWTGPKVIGGKKIEDSFRSHQVPIIMDRNNPETLAMLEEWLKSYRPQELFDTNGSLIPELRELAPQGDKRMGANPNANGGLLFQKLNVPNFKDYGINVPKPGAVVAQDMLNLGVFIRDIVKLNADNRNFRIFGPDEALSNRLNQVFEVTNRQWNAFKNDSDEFLNQDGRVIDSILSEHVCEGLLEGYLLTGRHGFFHSYEAFIRIVDSMTSQHAKLLKVCNEIPWRKPIASLNYILTSHVWQQDHNGYTHQNPGFLNHMVTKKADIVRIYLPFDTNSLLSCFDHIIKTQNYVNVIVASKHLRPQWLNIEEATAHCTKGIGIWSWASNDDGNPNVIMACAGDTPTLETLAATSMLRKFYPNLKVRVINVVDLMKLQPNMVHPHGLDEIEYNKLFPQNVPVIFAFHGYPALIHQLTYKRANDDNIHVHGYNEEGTITTPFDMRVQNKLDRYHLVMDALKYINIPGKEKVLDYCNAKLKEHHEYIREHGKDINDVINWKWE